MDRFGTFFLADAIQVEVKSVAEEGRDGRHELGYRYQAGVQRLVGRYFVVGVFTLPEQATAAPHIPVAEMFIYKSLNGAGRLHGFAISVVSVDFFRQAIKQGNNPLVDFRPVRERDVAFLIAKAVDIGI